jgi:AraC-like DNA-binding protein
MVGIVPPERPGILAANPGDPYLLCYCRFGGAYAASLAAFILAREGRRFFPSPHLEAVGDLIRRMGRVRRLDLPEQMGRAEVLLAEALVLLHGGWEAPLLQPSLTAFAVEEWLRAHLSQPTDLDAVAEAFGVSRSTLCRCLRQSAQTTVQKLHESLKLEWASHLLRNTGLNVTEVARRVGYADPFYFSRVFRRRYGVAPTRQRATGPAVSDTERMPPGPAARPG